MAGAFQSDAFQGDAFQEDGGTFTGGSGQAQCDVKQTYNSHGQAQCDIKAVSYAHGQAQCDVKAVGYGFGQAQCDVKAVGYGFGQANASILGAIQQFGQAQCDVKAVVSSCGQAQCDIKTQGWGSGQAQCYIPVYAFGQAQCDVKAKGNGFAQAQCDIKALGNGFGQAQCKVLAEEEPTSCSPIFTDTFSRISSGNPGTPDLGPDYADGGLSHYDNVTTDGDKLILTENVESFDDFLLTAPLAMGDGEFQLDFKIVSLRDFATYASISRIYNFGTGQVRFTAYDAGTQANLELYWQSTTPSTNDVLTVELPDKLDADTWYTVKFQIEGANLRGKLWITADPEPGTWDIELDTAEGDALVPGDRFDIYADTGDSETLEVVAYYDNLMICEMTVGITAGYGQAQALICAERLLDTFSRTFTGDPGTPDVGPNYTELDDSHYNFISADSSTLILAGTNDYDWYDIFADLNIADGEATIDFWLDEIRDWATMFDLLVRREPVSGGFRLQFYGYYDPDANETQIWFAGNENTATHAVVTINAETWYTAKFRFVGTQLQGKVWERSTSEPDWQIEDTTTLINPGFVEIYADIGEGGSDPTNILYDNWTVCSTSTPPRNGYGQAQCYIHAGTTQYGQAQADIKAIRRGHGQAQCFIHRTVGYGQANARIFGFPTRSGQANALILKWAGYGQAMASIRFTFRGYAQAQCLVNRSYAGAQAQCDVKTRGRGFGQAQCFIGIKTKGCGQAQCKIIKLRSNQSAQATALINSSIRQGWGQAQAYIFNRMTGQAQALIKKLVVKSGQAQAFILVILTGMGQAQAAIHVRGFGSGLAQCMVNLRLGTGQAQCFIPAVRTYTFGLSQAYIETPGRASGQALAEIGSRSSGQAQCVIRSPHSKSGQAQCFISKRRGCGQAQGWIKTTGRSGSGQAQAMLRSKTALAQAQCRIVLINMAATGQARVFINKNTHSGQAQAFINGSAYSPQYPVKFNGRFLPGYAQSEAYDSVMNTYKSEAAYMDLKFSEYTGLQNKVISLRFKVWTNNDFEDSKEDTQLAATIVRSSRAGFVPLYIQSMDKHYLALTKKFSTNNDTKATHTYDYEVEFECKPWLITDQTESITGSGLIDTGSRTIENGGWTPARLNITGTNVTVSGYTESGQFTGFISVSGVVANLEINSEAYTAKIAGVNKNEIMNNLDYALYVGPGKTFFDITGADDVTIEWEDRHYL